MATYKPPILPAVPIGPPANASFAQIAVSGQTTVIADTSQDILTFVAGSNVVLTTDDNANSIAIASTGSAAVSDGNKGEVVVASGGSSWTIPLLDGGGF